VAGSLNIVAPSRSLIAAWRGLAALAGLLLGTAIIAPNSVVATVVVVAVGIVIVAASRPVVPAIGGVLAVARSRAALERLAPIVAQSDPDARGHARPRAPGVLLPAV
jgi:hypothetical protein